MLRPTLHRQAFLLRISAVNRLWLIGALAGALALVLPGCASTPERMPGAEGTYRGATEDGREIVLTLRAEDDAVRGDGRVGDTPIALAGPLRQTATTWLVSDDGRGSPVRIDLHAGGASVTLETPDGPFLLTRGADATPAASGPFEGRYRAGSGGFEHAELDVVQRGVLLSGTGTMLGRPAALAGRVVDTNRARASLIFDDGSRLDIEIDRREGGALHVVGLEDDLTLEHVGGLAP